MSRNVRRRHVSMPGLLSTVRKVFDTVPDPTSHRDFSLSDDLMSGRAVFALTYPSLLKVDNATRGDHPNPALVHNLKPLFKVATTPSDSYLRHRLDVIDPASLRASLPIFNEARDGSLSPVSVILSSPLTGPGISV